MDYENNFHYPLSILSLLPNLSSGPVQVRKCSQFHYSIVIIQLNVQQPMTFNLLCCEMDESSKYSYLTSWCLKIWGIFA